MSCPLAWPLPPSLFPGRYGLPFQQILLSFHLKLVETEYFLLISGIANKANELHQFISESWSDQMGSTKWADVLDFWQQVADLSKYYTFIWRRLLNPCSAVYWFWTPYIYRPKMFFSLSSFAVTYHLPTETIEEFPAKVSNHWLEVLGIKYKSIMTEDASPGFNRYAKSSKLFFSFFSFSRLCFPWTNWLRGEFVVQT